MRYLLVSITILLLLTGCTMHPPSTAAFMEATEKERKTVSVRGEFSYYNVEDDGWDVPIALEYLNSDDGYTWGFGFLPSPYFTFGYGNKFLGVRTWISAPWLIGTLSVACLLGDDDDDDDDDKDEDKNDRYDIDFDNLGALPALWLVTFAGGASIIQQLPIGDHLRIGVEEFITRNVWIPVRDNNEWSAIEAGLSSYLNIRFEKWSLATEARYSLLDFRPKRSRWSIALTYTYYINSRAY